MKRIIFICITSVLLLSGCGSFQPAPTMTATPLPTKTPVPTSTPIPPTPTEAVDLTNPDIAPKGLPIEADLGGVKFAWGGEHEDIPAYWFDKGTGKWVEIPKVELSSDFPKTQAEIDALPPVTVEDATLGSMSRSTLESITDEEIKDLIPVTWSRALNPGIGGELVISDLDSIPLEIDLDKAQYSKSVRYGRLVDSDGNSLGVAAVIVYRNTDGSRVALTTFIDNPSWILDDFTAACMGLGNTWPSGADNKQRIHSPFPVFSVLPDRLDKLGSSLIYDIVDKLGGVQSLTAFKDLITNGNPMPKSATTLPMVVACMADGRSR